MIFDLDEVYRSGVTRWVNWRSPWNANLIPAIQTSSKNPAPKFVSILVIPSFKLHCKRPATRTSLEHSICQDAFTRFYNSEYRCKICIFIEVYCNFWYLVTCSIFVVSSLSARFCSVRENTTILFIHVCTVCEIRWACLAHKKRQITIHCTVLHCLFSL